MTNPESVQEMVRRRVRRRRLWRRVRFGALVMLVIVAVGGAAFGIDRMVLSLRKYYASPARTAKADNASVSSSTTTTTVSGPPNCVSGQLSGTVSNWRAISGTTYETVSLTNISASACTLLGYPGLAVNSANGTALPAATQDVATMGVSTGSAPAAPGRVIVAPEARAWFELSYPDTCDIILTPGSGPTATPNACYEGKWLQITPPRTSSPLLVPEPLRFTYGITGFDVGPFGTGSPPPLPNS
ncbi:MAG TPA: DUF4232 domain-containing protein [Acidimicrobiales bacterium]|nr:DUF4232 domain-containing protein [Acidimicrobiales bacterium]